MADLPDDDLEASRAALAPTLDAAAAILPWLARPRPPRFDPGLNERWIAAGRRLGAAWSDRHGAGAGEIRPAIFALYGVALESADADCLRLGEALASAADRLDAAAPPPRLLAALAAAGEALADPAGLEHEAFGERARHFAQRLEAAVALGADAGERSPVLDRLFVAEAHERLDAMRDALAALPPDAYALVSEAGEIAQQAELLELYGIMQLARDLRDLVSREPDLDNSAAGDRVADSLQRLAAAIAAVDA